MSKRSLEKKFARKFNANANNNAPKKSVYERVCEGYLKDDYSDIPPTPENIAQFWNELMALSRSIADR